MGEDLELDTDVLITATEICPGYYIYFNSLHNSNFNLVKLNHTGSEQRSHPSQNGVVDQPG